HTLAGIWTDLLGLDHIGATDNFFDLGGHSLLAMQLVTRLRDAFSADLPVTAIFDHPTVAGLATALRAVAPAVGIAPQGRSGPLPLSFAQQRLWFLARLDPDSTAYNVPIFIPLTDGEGDPTTLATALTTITERHEVLRTRLVTNAEGIPHQVIDPPAPFALDVVDADSEDEARTAVRKLAGTPFDLATGPLIRAALIRVRAGRRFLALCLHHVVCDEWSAGILTRELAMLCRGEEPPALTIQYADYASWQRAQLTGDRLDEALAYWRTELADPPVLELPTDRPRKPIRSTDGAVVTFTVPADVAAGLRAVSRRTGATMFMTLLTAYAVLLHRHTGQDDLLIGTPVAERGRPETENLIGFFLNTLVLRSRLDGDPTVTELIGRIRKTALGAYAHQDLPFESLVDEFTADRDRSRTPLIQTLFNHTRVVPADDQASMTPSVRFDLTMTLIEAEDGLRGVAEYSTALFDRDTIVRLTGHLATLLAEIAAEPDRTIAVLPMLTAPERAQLTAWNDTTAPVPDVASVAGLIGRQAAEAPDAVAVVHAGRTLTYAELERQSGRLAHRLRQHGAGPETIVGLCLDRGPAMIVAVLAVWKAGAAYLPLDPAYPPDRLAYILSDSGATLLLDEPSTAGRHPHEVTTITLDGTEPDATAQDADIRPGQLAYVIYTSGSTGRPKGVGNTHRGLLNLAAALPRLVQAGPGTTVLQFASMSFDASVWEMTIALTSGATLAIATAQEQSQPDRLTDLIQRHGITVATLPPSMLEALDPAAISGVTTLFSAGERIEARTAAEFAGGRRLINAYGPTETTVCAAAAELTAGTDTTDPPIGLPIANAVLHVLDAHLRPTPAGVPGEVYIGGAGLSRGYLGRPALTAATFVPDPFSAGGERLYRTGDLAQRLPDGRVRMLGRIDHQIKVRGHRIEPAEIQHALTMHPAVTAAVVVADRQRLVAYVVAPSGLPTADELRAHLRAGLPEHMIPSVFVELLSLPLTANGKLDRAALPAPEGERPELSGAYQAPETPTEVAVAGIWADLLDLDRVGATDNFFDLGGHSLLANRVVARIRAALGVEVPLALLFDHPTVSRLAAALGVTHAATPIIPVDREQPLPLSFAQQRLWFLAELDPESTEYHVSIHIPLPGPVDVERLASAITAVVARHEVLRTRLVVDADGVPHQVIDPPTPFELLDEAEAGRLRAPFDPATGPLIRGALLKSENLLVLSLHHVVCDEWSADILKDEILLGYDGSALPPLPVQYADYAAWQRGLDLGAQLAYWRQQLAGPPVLEVPTDRPRPPVRSTAGAVVTVDIPADVAEGLRELSRRHGATMFMTLAAAYALLLHRHTGQDDLLIGTPVANRGRAETENLIGFFLNTLALRARFHGDPTFSELLGQVRATALDAFHNQDLPFERLVDDLVGERDRSRTPLVQTLFNHIDRKDRATITPELRREVPFDLALATAEDTGGLHAAFEYSTALFDEATIRRMAGHLATLLAAITADPDVPVSGLDMLTDGEVAWLDGLAGPQITPGAGTILDLIEVTGTPAVVCGEQSLSYRELDDRSGRLAADLSHRGVRPDDIVGIRLPRGIDFVVAVLAVWKAGAAYLPLDPALPAARLDHMIADSRPAAILTDVTAATATPFAADIRPGQAAYVIYTSGTTGKPKGVVNTHQGLLNVTMGLAPHYRLEPGDPALQFASFNFDAAAADIALVLTSGATLVIATDEERSDPWPVIERHGIRHLNISPSLLATLDPDRIPAGSSLIVGSEPFPPGLALAWAGKHRLHNAYGPTEAAVITTIAPVSAEQPRPPIGRPLPNTRAYLLDQHLNPVPVGVIGEIHLA
ncbi:amino acid adenylation domain-containing protein, partial [Micromonospora chersina]|uniref:amino acid adenylation domain-containing protein n=1 Tax=Micromonospora chersina TaxID=47854 RepID=UPI003713399B